MLEGFHALKHALRFGAEVEEALAADMEELERLAGELAPDLAEALPGRVTPVDAETIAQLVPQAPRTGVVAIARRPAVDVAALLAADGPAPLVLLEEPRTMGNMGACVRVAAAADAAGVLTTGGNDPWHPDALRGAAGLHYALPVAAIEALPESDRPAGRDRSRGEDLRPGASSPRGDPRLRHRAPRAQRGAPGAGRRPPRDPDAGGRLQPQSRHLGRRRAFFPGALNLGRICSVNRGDAGDPDHLGSRARVAAIATTGCIAALQLLIGGGGAPASASPTATASKGRRP